jgi:hypothetical protein
VLQRISVKRSDWLASQQNTVNPELKH